MIRAHSMVRPNPTSPSPKLQKPISPPSPPKLVDIAHSARTQHVPYTIGNYSLQKGYATGSPVTESVLSAAKAFAFCDPMDERRCNVLGDGPSAAHSGKCLHDTTTWWRDQTLDGGLRAFESLTLS